MKLEYQKKQFFEKYNFEHQSSKQLLHEKSSCHYTFSTTQIRYTSPSLEATDVQCSEHLSDLSRLTPECPANFEPD